MRWKIRIESRPALLVDIACSGKVCLSTYVCTALCSNQGRTETKTWQDITKIKYIYTHTRRNLCVCVCLDNIEPKKQEKKTEAVSSFLASSLLDGWRHWRIWKEKKKGRRKKLWRRPTASRRLPCWQDRRAGAFALVVYRQIDTLFSLFLLLPLTSSMYTHSSTYMSTIWTVSSRCVRGKENDR